MWCPASGKNCQLTGCTRSYQMCKQSSSTHPELFISESEKIKALEQRIKLLEEENAKLRAHIQNINAAGNTGFKYYY